MKRRSPSKRQAGTRRTVRKLASRAPRRSPARRTAAAAYGGQRGLQAAGARDGAAWRGGLGDGREAEWITAANAAWSRRCGYALPGGGKPASWNALLASGRAYAAGFARGAGVSGSLVPVPLRGSASAVLYAGRGGGRLGAALAALGALPLHEIIVVAGDGADEAYALAKSLPNALIASMPGLNDGDVGRALGAKLTGSDIVLVADAASPATAEQYARFLWLCDGRLDVALNELSDRWGHFAARSDVQRFGELLNTSLGRPDLRGNTMAHLPYALSRKALDTLGPAALIVPPKAHASALLSGLTVGMAGAAAIGRASSADAAHWRRTAGDYLEAWSEAFALRGSRLKFNDTIRNRSALGEWTR